MTAIDKLRAAVEEGTLPRKVRDLLEDRLDAETFQSEADLIQGRAEEIREQIEGLESEAEDIETEAQCYATVAEAIGAALDQVEEWEGAEGRDEKADARESLLGALNEIVAAFDEIPESSAPLFDEDGYDILSDDERAANAIVEQLAHATVADWLAKTETDLVASLPEGEGVPRKDILAAEIRAIISALEARGTPEFYND